jgi:hypothetical protein
MLKARVIPLIKRLSYSSWRKNILYVQCPDLVIDNQRKCIVSTSYKVGFPSEGYQVILDDYHLPFKKNTFDMVVLDLSSFLKKEHVLILSQVHQVLNLSGKALICNQNSFSLNLCEQLLQKSSRNYFSIKSLIAHSGFEILTEHPFSFSVKGLGTTLNKKLIRHEKKIRQVLPILSNFHCFQVIKSNLDRYQPLPAYMRLSKSLTPVIG